MRIRLPLILSLLVTPGVIAREPQLNSRIKATAEATLAKAVFETNARTLTLYDRRGAIARTIGDHGYYRWPTLSPDGRRIAVVKQQPGDRDSGVWVVDLSSGITIQVVSTPAVHESPVWSPDGRYLAYVRNNAGSAAIFRKVVDGTGFEELLYRSSSRLVLTDWSSDGRYLSVSSVQTALDPEGLRSGLYLLPLDAIDGLGQRNAIEVFRSDKVRAIAARFSPDGRFLAYRSNESGANQIWVRSAAPSSASTAGGPWQISTQGALGMATWRRDGKELYYLDADRHVMAVAIDIDRRFSFEVPKRLFDAPDTTTLVADYPFPGAPDGLGTISVDGERFLFAEAPKSRGAEFLRQLTVFDRRGAIVRTVGPPGEYTQPLFSPDGKHLAAYKGRAMWVFDLSSGESVQATPSGSSYSLSWSPDSRQVAYVSYREDHSVVYRKSMRGTGREVPLYRHPEPGAFIPLTDWSLDGRFLWFNGGNVLWAAPITSSESHSHQLPSEAYNVFGARMSPDGRFVAYASDESGRLEIYVRPFDARSGFQGRKQRVSTGGGLGLVQWRRDGRELYYLSEQGQMMAVEITTTPILSIKTPTPLFQVPDVFPRERTNYPDCSCAAAAGCEQGSVRRDGQQFVFAIPVPPTRREATVDAQVLANYAGSYDLAGDEVKLTLEGNRLTYQRGRDRYPLFVGSETTLFLTATNGEFEFFKDDSGVVSYFLFYRGGPPQLGLRR